MRLQRRRQLIDEINDAFIEFLKEYRGRKYEQFFRNINRDLINNIETLTPEMVSTIIDRYEMDTEDIAIYSLILGAITTILEQQRLKQKQREALLPIIGVISIYSIRKPKRFVKKLQKSISNPQSQNERKVQGLILIYKNQNKDVIERIKREQIKNIKRAQTISKIKQSREMLKEMERMTRDGLSLEKQRNILTRKYNNRKLINRAIDTEVHANIESGKHIQAEDDGFTEKMWKTQEDDKVRKTTWHNQVKNKWTPIKDDFSVGKLKATAPGDMSLPPGERINCRCYLIFR